jgi:hypothetical protein
MRLAFITSAYRTIFDHAVALRLEDAGHEVYWLSPNNRWARWLLQQGVPPERILDITARGAEWGGKGTEVGEEDRDELRALERASGWNVYDLILMDDLLSRRSTSHALRYLAACARHARAFLANQGIDAVAGELTWAFELIVSQVCASLGVAFLRATSIRIPDGRFAFFPGRQETSPLCFREPGPEEREQARRFLQEYRSRPAPPAYMSINWSVLRVEWRRTCLLLKHLADVAGDPFDETTLRPLPLVGKYLAKAWRARRNRRSRLFHKPTLPPGRPFVLYTLHLEPEASIDVLGSPFCNQVELVRALARTLPVTHELWVKEHRVALPNRSAAFYRELSAIPGVRLIDPFASSLALIPHAELVIAVTGTACYEAALLGWPAVTLAPTVFDPILAGRFNPFAGSLTDLLDSLRDRPGRSDEERLDFLAWLLAQSWPGMMGDALWLPDSLRDENVGCVAAAYAAALQVVAARSANKGAISV